MLGWFQGRLRVLGVSDLQASKWNYPVSLLDCRPTKDEVQFQSTKSHDTMELRLPGEDPKPMAKPDRDLMMLVDGMLGEMSCDQVAFGRRVDELFGARFRPPKIQ